jgi:hypothetical protein
MAPQVLAFSVFTGRWIAVVVVGGPAPLTWSVGD